jgi:4a-hydroxytetrahydrobiopterin dehydratase
MKISEINCDACRVDASRVTSEEQNQFMGELPEWSVVCENDINKLRRSFKFPNFVSALAFTNKVGALAEEYGHHPDILTEWGKTTVTWWSHKIKGLHQLDFALAKKTQELLS